MLENFLVGVCGFTGTFRLADRLDKCIQAIKQVSYCALPYEIVNNLLSIALVKL